MPNTHTHAFAHAYIHMYTQHPSMCRSKCDFPVPIPLGRPERQYINTMRATGPAWCRALHYLFELPIRSSLHIVQEPIKKIKVQWGT